MPNEYIDELGGGDQIPDETVALCNWMNYVMKLESRYKDITTF
jgi:hypothetical protein